MARILTFTTGPDDWKALLADPEIQWRTRYSARTLAHCWEAAEGFPPEIASVLSAADDPLLDGLEPLLAVPEFKVPLPGGERASQNDIFVLARARGRPVAIMVEGKVDESFGPTLGEWLVDASPGKQQRLRYLLRMLGLADIPSGEIRYQLLHRAASAVIVADQYRASAAMLIVHTFTTRQSGWSDYAAFLKLFGVQAEASRVQRLSGPAPVPLFASWIPGEARFLDC